MNKPPGRNIAISPFRRLVIDLMRFSKKVPSVTLERVMDLSPLIAARDQCAPKPTWTGLFIKAYSILAARNPLLRRSFMSFPWPHFYEHPKNIAQLNVSRVVNGEDIVLQAHIRSPQNRSLVDIDRIIHSFMETPVEEIPSYVRVRRVSHLPFFIRRLLWWATLNIFGRRRCHNFGTFGITSVAGHGAGVQSLTPLLTSTLFYGLFDAQGRITMRLGFDHRVIDGVPGAQTLMQLESVLLGEILEEVRGMARPNLPHAA
jgi:hypothetical protein